jgi:adenylate kinase family enzyme
MIKPYLLVVTGRPGAGKTTFAKELGKQLCLPVISRDEIKEGYVHTFGESHSRLPEETNKIVTDIFFQTINNLADANVSLVAEAAFQHKVWESKLNMLNEKTRLFMLICKVQDDAIYLERFINRRLENPMREYFHGDNGVELSRRGDKLDLLTYDEPHLDVPTIYIDTTGDYTPTIKELKAEIFD